MSNELRTRRFRRLMRELADERGVGRCHGCGRRLDSPEMTITSGTPPPAGR